MVRALVEWHFWLLFVVVCVVSLGFTLTAGRLACRIPQSGETLPGGVGELFGIIGAAFGIILAFIIFVQWSATDHMSSAIEAETASLASILRYTDTFDPSGLINRAVLDYRDVIVDVEIPALRRGDLDSAWKAGAEELDNLVSLMEGIAPPSGSQAFYDKAVDHVDSLTSTRRDRVEISQTDLSLALWSFVVISTLIVLLFVALIRPADSLAAVLMLSAVAVFVGLTLSLVISLNYPLNGPLSVSLDPYFTGKLAG